MLLEAILIIGISYIVMGLCLYMYSVVKTYEIIKVWDFKIKDGYIGLCEYPRWTLIWLEKIVGGVKNERKRRA